MIRKILAAISDAIMPLGLISAAPLASAVEAPLRPVARIRCDFYYQGQCYDHWIPTPDSCKGVGVWGTARQQASCMALFGVGHGGSR